jgi:hypothetical protein
MLIYELFEPRHEPKEPLLELRATAPGVKIYDDPMVGVLTPDQVHHNLNMLKQGKAELDWKDHLGQQIQDASNAISWNTADKVAAYIDSLRNNTKYADELNKYRDLTAAYGANKQAINLRQGVKAATGYEMPQDLDIPGIGDPGNITPGDIVGNAALTPVLSKLYNWGAKGAKGNVGKVIKGGAAMMAPGMAAAMVGEPEPTPPPPPPTGPRGGVREGMGFLGEKDVDEAASAAQQAAIAIAMKKAHKKPRTK